MAEENHSIGPSFGEEDPVDKVAQGVSHESRDEAGENQTSDVDPAHCASRRNLRSIAKALHAAGALGARAVEKGAVGAVVADEELAAVVALDDGVAVASTRMLRFRETSTLVPLQDCGENGEMRARGRG
jgi:hypothetical protein